MAHSIDKNQNIIVKLEDFMHVESVKHREKMAFLCADLKKFDGIDYFSMEVCFPTKERYVVSNIPLWSIPYHTEGYYQASFTTTLTEPNYKNCIVHSKYDVIGELHQYIWQVMRNHYKIHPTFAIVRNFAKIKFVFQAFSKFLINDPEKTYQNNKNEFDKFCFYFVTNTIEQIKGKYKKYSDLHIFNNKKALENIILFPEKSNLNSHLTKRELECLHLLSLGKTAKEAARLLNISPETLRTHTKVIRNKLNASNITHAITEAIKLGIL